MVMVGRRAGSAPIDVGGVTRSVRLSECIDRIGPIFSSVTHRRSRWNGRCSTKLDTVLRVLPTTRY